MKNTNQNKIATTTIALGFFKGYFMIMFWPVTIIMWMCGCFKNN